MGQTTDGKTDTRMDSSFGKFRGAFRRWREILLSFRSSGRANFVQQDTRREAVVSQSLTRDIGPEH